MLKRKRTGASLDLKKLGFAELNAAVKDADAALAGARLAKFFELSPGVFRLKFNSQTKGEVNVLVDLGFGAFLATRVPESPEAPTQFASAVRSKIDNAVLNGVSLVNNDRVLRFDFEKKEKFALVFEFVGSGNALLLGDGAKIVFVWKPAVYSSRKLALREQYAAPPAGGKTPSAESVARSNTEIEADYWSAGDAAGGAAPRKKENRALAALEKSLEAQRASLPMLEDEENGALAAGNWIKEHRDECEEITAAAKSNDGPALKKARAKKSGATVEIDAA